MITNILDGKKAPTPLCGNHLQYISSIQNAQPAVMEITVLHLEIPNTMAYNFVSC